MRLHSSHHHYASYGVLVVGLLLAAVGFMAVWPDRWYQRLVIAALLLYYISWGVVTHLLAHHLTKRVFYEYIGIALLGGSLLFLITL